MEFATFDEKWREPITFEIDVAEVKSGCRAGHHEGDRFTFSWNTPEGLCGEAFVGMYPVLFSLRTKGNMKLLGSEKENTRVYNCPGRVVKFHIKAAEKCCLCGKSEGLAMCEVLLGETPSFFRLCPECRGAYGR